MLWIALAAAAAMAGVTLGLIFLRGHRRAKGNRADKKAARRVPMDPAVSLFGLRPTDDARMRRAARAEMERAQAQWERDYLPAASDGGLPGRIAGLPRTLRVRN